MKPSLPMSAVESLGLDALCPWERRATASVGLGCPSFGGQRTVRGGSSRRHASLVTGLRQQLLAPLGQNPGTCQRPTPPLAVLCEKPVPVHHLRPRRPLNALPLWCWPHLVHQMLEVSTRQRRAQVVEIQAFSAVSASRSGHPLAQPGSPNPSVKGTSCGKPQAAPYVER